VVYNDGNLVGASLVGHVIGLHRIRVVVAADEVAVDVQAVAVSRGYADLPVDGTPELREAEIVRRAGPAVEGKSGECLCAADAGDDRQQEESDQTTRHNG